MIRKKNKIISTQINHHYFHFKPTKKLSLMPSSPAQRMRQIDDMKQSFPSQLFSFNWSDQNTSKNWKNASISQKEHELFENSFLIEKISSFTNETVVFEKVSNFLFVFWFFSKNTVFYWKISGKYKKCYVFRRIWCFRWNVLFLTKTPGKKRKRHSWLWKSEVMANCSNLIETYPVIDGKNSIKWK